MASDDDIEDRRIAYFEPRVYGHFRRGTSRNYFDMKSGGGVAASSSSSSPSSSSGGLGASPKGASPPALSSPFASSSGKGNTNTSKVELSSQEPEMVTILTFTSRVSHRQLDS